MINLLVVYGEGGHRAEAMRFIKVMAPFDDVNILTCGTDDISDFTVYEVREKHSNTSIISGFLKSLKIVKGLYQFLKCEKITHIVSFGPGVSIIPVIIGKLCKLKTSHIETSCRFESKSNTGRVLFNIVDEFYVQNTELLNVYEGAKYIGRL